MEKKIFNIHKTYSKSIIDFNWLNPYPLHNSESLSLSFSNKSSILWALSYLDWICLYSRRKPRPFSVKTYLHSETSMNPALIVMSKYFSRRLKLRLALNIILVLLTPEFAASKIAATIQRRSRFLPN